MDKKEKMENLYKNQRHAHHRHRLLETIIRTVAKTGYVTKAQTRRMNREAKHFVIFPSISKGNIILDDDPTDGPDVYYILNDFSTPDTMNALIRSEIPVSAVIKLTGSLQTSIFGDKNKTAS